LPRWKSGFGKLWSDYLQTDAVNLKGIVTALLWVNADTGKIGYQANMPPESGE
jgi:hypothetical protein